MKERPIIFNAEMVNAILSGRKTQTRRVIKPQPSSGVRKSVLVKSGVEDGHGRELVCPFGEIGDRLWVREAYQGPLIPEDEVSDFNGANPDKFYTSKYCEYAADGGPRPEYVDGDDNTRYGWRPSIHMPRWASRITLEITGVRVERLNSISEEDAAAEGVQLAGDLLPNYPGTYLTPKGDFATAKVAFQRLWESIYGADGWQANPWVWVIEFKMVEQPHGQ